MKLAIIIGFIVAGVLVVALYGTVGYVTVHFITKWW
jgi:hypothetical protein